MSKLQFPNKSAANPNFVSLRKNTRKQKGLEIVGEANCKEFLVNYRAALLAQLIDRIRLMNRQKLTAACGIQYQSARAEQDHWRSTIRAMRAIRGAEADTTAFKRQNAMNGIQRASKTVCEIAACEGSDNAGLDPHQEDIDELFALALLVVSSGQLFALISSGLHEPTLRISPAGDVLSDHTVQTTVMRPSVELYNRRTLDEAAQAYPRRHMRQRTEDDPAEDAWTPALRAAIETEYQTPIDSFVNLPYALARMAQAHGQGVFITRRGDLAAALHAAEDFPSDDIGAFLARLTLPRRSSWSEIPTGQSESDYDPSRFDRPFSIINRPLVALDDDPNPVILVAPAFVSDACTYSFTGLRQGTLNNAYWVSDTARAYAGSQGHAKGEKFEDDVGERLQNLGLAIWTRRPLSWALNMKVDPVFGNIDVLAVSHDRRRVWVIEAKDLKLCRTEIEVASRFSEYRGRMHRDRRGRETPDKMLRHLRRVEFMRTHAERLCARLGLEATPEVRGMLIVDAPQPMNFVDGHPADGQTVMLGAVDEFQF